MTDALIPEELAALDALAAANGAFRRCPEHHPADVAEWTFHLHALQNMLMARAAVRAYPEEFTPLEPAVKPSIRRREDAMEMQVQVRRVEYRTDRCVVAVTVRSPTASDETSVCLIESNVPLLGEYMRTVEDSDVAQVLARRLAEAGDKLARLSDRLGFPPGIVGNHRVDLVHLNSALDKCLAAVADDEGPARPVEGES